MRNIPILLVLLVAFGGACSREAPTTGASRDTLTRRQKDSVIAQSAIPGASGVGKALSAQDSGASRNRVVDSIATAP